MSTDDEVLELIKFSESETLEFKRSLSDTLVGNGIQSLVAFANRSGGKVLFGVEDDRTVVGVPIEQHTLENLANRITARTYPSLVPHIRPIEIQGRSLCLRKLWPTDRR